MTETTTERSRETVEAELERATKSRDRCARELREVRGELEQARSEEAGAFEEAAVTGKKLTASKGVRDLEAREGEVSRQLEAMKQLVTRLDFERREFRLGELNAEVERLSAYAEQARQKKREAAEEATRAGNEAVAVRQERDDVKRSLSRKIPRSADRPNTYIRI